jgi:hypothetical protein
LGITDLLFVHTCETIDNSRESKIWCKYKHDTLPGLTMNNMQIGIDKKIPNIMAEIYCEDEKSEMCI